MHTYGPVFMFNMCQFFLHVGSHCCVFSSRSDVMHCCNVGGRER